MFIIFNKGHRMYKTLSLLALICSLHLTAGEPQEPTNIEIDSFDYSTMLKVSSAVLTSVFGERIQEIAGTDGKLVPANDEEKMALVFSFGYFLMAVARMQQEAACLNDTEQGYEMVRNVFEQGCTVFSVVPEELQAAGVRLALDWIEEHAEDSWQPTEHMDMYKPFSELPAARSQAVKYYYKLLGSILE